MTPAAGGRPPRRLVTGIALAGVLLASADTYVIVLALPAIMAGLGLGLDQLQAATPIISGFLLGYVVVMPLLGRLSDLHGRRRVLLICLALFAAGSLVTASAHGLAAAVVGRALQGLGGGGLVPVTLALIADWWSAEERGLPLGVAGAVQELGSVAGPLYGAAILAVADWRAIFWINLPLAAVLAIGCVAAWRRPRSLPRRRDGIGAGLAAIALGSGALAIAAPDPLAQNAVLGALYTPLPGIAVLTPLGAIAIAAGCAFAVWELCGTVESRLLPLRAVMTPLRAVDWPGALLLAGVLAAIVLSFTGADPSVQAFSAGTPWLLGAAAMCAALLVVRERRARHPLIRGGDFRSAPAAGALLCNLALGAALMTALVDVPILARATAYPGSQLGAALVLVRLLVAVPIGALLGGRLIRAVPARAVAGAGLAVSSASFAVMATWSATTLSDPLAVSWLHPSDPVLAACGLGFGLAIAPVNASLLGAVRASIHGVASSLLVVARMVGMLVGISVLTAVGLRAFYIRAAALPSPAALCPHSPLSCSAYDSLITGAIVEELHTVFFGAALCAGAAAVIAAAALRAPRAASSIITAHA